MAEHAINRLYMDTEDKPAILIADDSRVVRVSLKNILKDDCQLIEAEDGQQAWELLLEHPHVQMIFSDLSMPRLNGRVLLNKVRESEITRIRNLPFIVVTGNEDDAQSRKTLLDDGATEVVTKPFDTANIISLTRTLISQQESESIFILPDEPMTSKLIPDTSDQKAFLQAASKELSFAIRNKNELAIALIRIDQYDELEEHYSENAVDHILLNLADIIRKHVHPDDVIGYFGNGLYAILRPASNAIGTRYIGRRILEDLAAKQFCLGETEEIISASMGISAPEIKPRTRLKELLLLAESRLKSAIDLGGNRVIDKGNETLQPVDTSSDRSQDLSVQGSSFLEHSITADISVSQSQSNGLAASSSRASQCTSGDNAASPQVVDLQRQISLLIKENQDLQTQVLRWHGQSGESEQLRQRVFELESEQQQAQVRLSELSSIKQDLQQRLTQSEHEKQLLIDNNQEHNVTLEQANQFYEEENQRLQLELNSLNERAQKAEFAFKEAQQQNSGLRKNITQLREQLEQIQGQLIATQQQALEAQARPQPPATEIDSEQTFSSNDSSILDQPSESELFFNGFPSTEESPKLKEADTELLTEKANVEAKADKSEESEVNPALISIPIYRHEPESLPRERKPLSSFAIASMLLILLLGLGGGYFYYYLQQPKEEAIAAVTKSTTPASVNAGNSATDAGTDTAVQAKKAERPSPQQPAAKRSEPAIEDAKTAAAATTPVATSSQSVATTAPAAKAKERLTEIQTDAAESTQANLAELPADEARLEAELRLRQMAEEEFNQQLMIIGTTSAPLDTDADTTYTDSGPTPQTEAVSQ